MESVLSFDNLYKALKKSCRNVRWKTSVITYESNALKNTYTLRKELLDHTYKIGEYQIFRIHEPKEREIKATKIKDRQFQHSLCDNMVYDALTADASPNSCACMQGRGVDYCLNRVTKHMVDYNRKYGNTGWVLKCDIHRYFDSIPHRVARREVRRRVDDDDAVIYIYEIISSFDKGIGLGSQLSQLIANAILQDMDNMLEKRYCIKHYIRYADDFVLMHPDKKHLEACLRAIRTYLAERGLELNPKTCIYPMKQGVKMLNWHFYIMPSGRILRRMACKRPGKQRRKLKRLWEKEKVGQLPQGTTEQSHRSWMANAARGDTWEVRRRMNKYVKELTR